MSIVQGQSTIVKLKYPQDRKDPKIEKRVQGNEGDDRKDPKIEKRGRDNHSYPDDRKGITISIDTDEGVT